VNERIRELAEQAGYESDMFGVGHWDMPECKKFFELIVRECIDIVKPTSDHEAFAQNYLGGVDGLELLDGKIKNIKQHFGVRD
jgi:hypothetical protein